jgi:hypothetical protein
MKTAQMLSSMHKSLSNIMLIETKPMINDSYIAISHSLEWENFLQLDALDLFRLFYKSNKNKKPVFF